MTIFYVVTSRAEFFKQLDIAINETARLQKNSSWSILDSFFRQLEAMKQLTQHGRKPTFDERKSISMGRVAQREIQGTSDVEWSLYMAVITELTLYFKYWRSDAGLLTLDEDDWRTDFPGTYDLSDE